MKQSDPRIRPGEFSISVSIFGIWGNKNFKTPKDYAGPFKTSSISGIKGLVYNSKSSSCKVYGVGYYLIGTYSGIFLQEAIINTGVLVMKY